MNEKIPNLAKDINLQIQETEQIPTSINPKKSLSIERICHGQIYPERMPKGSSPNRRRDFPGGPVVKNLPSNAGNMGSIPGQGTKPVCRNY